MDFVQIVVVALCVGITLLIGLLGFSRGVLLLQAAAATTERALPSDRQQ
jgi:hypothetical protein